MNTRTREAIQSAAGCRESPVECDGTEWASSYLLRARCGAFQRGAFEGATGALGVHAEESDLKPELTRLNLTKPNLISPVFREW